MKELLNYLFRPSKNSREAVRSAYYGSLKPTHVMLTISVVMCMIFMVLSFFNTPFFGTTAFYHRICYCVLFGIALIWCACVRYAVRDYESRFKIVYAMNVLMSAIFYAWALALAFVNAIMRKELDTTIFMTVSLIVPLSIYLNPIEYIISAIASNAGMVFLLYSAPSLGLPEDMLGLVNFIVFAVFQIAMGITMLYTRYRLHEQLETAARQHREIEMLNKAQNSFFSNMSHEIRTPINTIIGLNEMILRENVSDEVVEDAANIKAAGKLLLNLINDILDMSKFQSGRMQLLYAPYHTGDMLSDIVGMLWIRAKEKKLDFHIDVSPDIPAELVGDEVRVKQILINVINNAIKYTKEGTVSLTVQSEMKEDKLCNMIYTVSDTGIGIKTEDIPYLFSAFKRVDENANRHIEGTGLGLSIVKQLVDLMGGKITVNSVYTKGSTFIIEIPQRVEREGRVGEYNFSKTNTERRQTTHLSSRHLKQGSSLSTITKPTSWSFQNSCVIQR